MLDFVLIGAGNRGRIYSNLALESGKARIVALAEPNELRRADAMHALGVPAERCYADADALFAQGKLGDACIVTSLDQHHYLQAMRAMELGYDLLLEKPIAPAAKECVALCERAQALHRKVTVCHVLRYTPYFRAIKAVVDSGRFGRIVDIQHNENIGNFHMAHSFVRGNWNNAERTSPIILAKTCHDMDLLVWLTGSRCKSIASMGSLSYFKPENAPAGSADRCMDCAVAADCRFDARKVYLPLAGQWPANVLCVEQTEAALLEAIKTGPYGRCVYHCDNDVCDHQVAAIEFENGVTATFNMSAFSERICRTTKIMFEHGELRGNDLDNVIELTAFPSNALAEVHHEVIRPHQVTGGHGGGDDVLMQEYLQNAGDSTAIERSVESHLMSFAAEESRVSGKLISMADFRDAMSGGAHA